MVRASLAWSATVRVLGFLLSLLCLALPYGAQAQAGYREDSLADFMERSRDSAVSDYESRLGGLHESYLGMSASRDRKLVSLALGVHYLERNPRLALQYLTSAELACRDTDPVLRIVRFYLAQARLKAGAYQEAMALAAELIEGQPGAYWSKQLYAIQIEAAFGANDFDQVVTSFEEFTKSFSIGRGQEVLARFAATAFERKGEMKRATEVLEELARGYPTTEESRWAFYHLDELACDAKKVGRPKYYYSTRLLLNLSRNVILGTGLKEFIVNIIDRPVRHDDEGVRTMTLAEKADFLFRARLYRESLEMTRQLYDIERANPESKIVPNVVFELGRIHLRLWEPMMASRYFSKFVADYPRHPNAPRALEYLGDSLRNAGLPIAAAENYALSASQRDSRLLRWHHFWSLLRGRQYQGALALLEQPDYVQPRDGDDGLTIAYWHARILEQLGRKEEAEAKFLTILGDNADSYYANVVAALRPDLLSRRPALAAVGEEPGGMALAAKLLPKAMGIELGGEALPGSQTPDMKLVDDLLKVGMTDAANIQLANLNWSSFSQEQTFATASRLADSLEDYNPTRRIRYSTFSSLRNLPKDWWEFIKHQATNAAEWKVYYPIAYEKTVTEVANKIRINPFLVLSVMRAESFYNKEARSGVGAQGLMQLMPYTAMKIATLVKDQDFDVMNLGKPEVNIGYGAYYLDKLLRYYGDNPFLAVAAYNGGPIAVNQWLDSCKDCTSDEFVESIQYRETRRYVREVMRNYAQYMRIYTGRQFLSELPAMPAELPDGEEIF